MRLPYFRLELDLRKKVARILTHVWWVAHKGIRGGAGNLRHKKWQLHISSSRGCVCVVNMRPCTGAHSCYCTH